MPYRKQTADVLAGLESSPAGLTGSEVARRLERDGPNSLETETVIHPVLIFISQFKNFIIYILLFAVFFSILIGEYVDSLIILAILLLNALIGFFQELSAHNSLAALKKMTAVRARVIREGKEGVVDADELVVGDLLVLEAGDKVPADARILSAVRMKAEEAVLTGESLPVAKNDRPLAAEAQIGDQTNMLFASTAVVNGHGRAVVTATGMRTEIGRITELVKSASEEMTPLQRRLDRFGKKLGLVIITICGFIFLASCAKEYLNQTITIQLFVSLAFVAISLAVAAVPTALPAVVTIALSIGVKRLLHKKALVRKLASVETLGSCDVICTDKTGTLTENRMTVRRAWSLAGETVFSGPGDEPVGQVSGPITTRLLLAGLICNNASLTRDSRGWQLNGDPTEAALLVSGVKAGIVDAAERLDENPFDSDRKLMSVLVVEDGCRMIYAKGALDQVLARCDLVLDDEGLEIELTREIRDRIVAQTNLYASQAMRVLAMAYRTVGDSGTLREEGLVFAGLQAMVDPPRADVQTALVKTVQAGIRVIMITGDYLETAQAIGRELGIEGRAVTGEQVATMDRQALVAVLKNNTNIFARVIPEHKLKIVAALQQMGHTVAMTGDGVNDAPALKQANIGVAVGSGTEVAKEAADFVLLDDSFSHIVNAIEEGRGIYDNIQKSIMLLLSGNFGEVLIIFLAVILGLNLPLTAILLLWINMVTDGAPALAYSVDPYGSDIMFRRPKSRDEGILPRQKLVLIGVLGTVGSVIALVLFSLTGGGEDAGLARARTMVFNFVVLYELILVFVIRHGYRVPFFSNIWVWSSVVVSLGLQALLMYTPLNGIFKIMPLGPADLVVLGGAGLLFYAVSVGYEMLAWRFSRWHP